MTLPSPTPPAAGIADVLRKLENAMDGSLELDTLVCAAVFGISDTSAKKYLRAITMPFMGFEKPPEFDTTWRAYTRSVDAALTLVPEGWIVSDLRQWSLAGGWYWSAALIELMRPGSVDVGQPGDSPRIMPPSPALAICIAALRAIAIAAQEERQP